MSLLDQLRAGPGPAPSYPRLGYLTNPFPARGQVREEVFAERPELADLQRDFVQYVKDGGAGRVYALAGESGVGKSNYLQHVKWTIEQLSSSRLDLACHYMTSQQAAPRALVQGVLTAIGEARIRALLRAVKERRVEIPAHVLATDLGRFFDSLRGSATQAGRDLHGASRFLLRWIGGEQTYSQERLMYLVQAKERMVPATALAYLRSLMDLLDAHGSGVRLVLLLDEFEDVQALRGPVQTDYLMAIKGLANTFNLDRVFLIIAGQDGAFEAFELRVPSLQTRWKRARLSLLTTSAGAVALANEYKRHANLQFAAERGISAAANLSVMEPTDDTVVARYTALAEKSDSRRREVIQRDLLEELHRWVEERARM